MQQKCSSVNTLSIQETIPHSVQILHNPFVQHSVFPLRQFRFPFQVFSKPPPDALVSLPKWSMLTRGRRLDVIKATLEPLSTCWASWCFLRASLFILPVLFPSVCVSVEPLIVVCGVQYWECCLYAGVFARELFRLSSLSSCGLMKSAHTWAFWFFRVQQTQRGVYALKTPQVWTETPMCCKFEGCWGKWRLSFYFLKISVLKSKENWVRNVIWLFWVPLKKTTEV